MTTSASPEYIVNGLSPRISWVSEVAQRRWEPRLRQFAVQWRQLELFSVIHGLRNCGLMACTYKEFTTIAPYLRKNKIKCRVLKVQDSTIEEGALVVKFAFGSAKNIKLFKSAWRRSDHKAVGRLLGYPACCCETFVRSVRVGSDPFEPADPASCKNGAISAPFAVDCQPETNLFLKPLGLGLVPHLPCCLTCEESFKNGRRFLKLANDMELRAVSEWGYQMMSWPLEWSKVNGIVEVMTPIFRFNYNATRNERKVVVVKRGNSFPEEGAAALRSKLGGSILPGVCEDRMAAPSPKSILDDIAVKLTSEYGKDLPLIREIYELEGCIVVQLDDLSVGLCVDPQLRARRDTAAIRDITHILFSDSIESGSEKGPNRESTALRIALLNALSSRHLLCAQDCLTERGVRDFSSLFFEIEIAIVFRSTSFAENLTKNTRVKHVYLCLSDDYEGSKQMEPVHDVGLNKKISVVNLATAASHAAQADLVYVPGGFLFENRLKNALRIGKNCRYKIFSGFNAGMHPRVLFEAGITHIATPLTTPQLAYAAFWNSCGKKPKPLSGLTNLRWKYIARNFQNPTGQPGM